MSRADGPQQWSGKWVEWIKSALQAKRGPRHGAAELFFNADGVMQFWGYLRNSGNSCNCTLRTLRVHNLCGSGRWEALPTLGTLHQLILQTHRFPDILGLFVLNPYNISL